MKIPPVGTQYKKVEIPVFIKKLISNKYIQVKNYRIAHCTGKTSIYIGQRFKGCNYTITFDVKKNDNYIACPNCGNEYEYEELLKSSSLISEIYRINYKLIQKDIIKAIQQCEFEIIEMEENIGNYVIKKRTSQAEYLVIFSGKGENRSYIIDAIELKTNIIYIDVFHNNDTLPETVIKISGIEILLNGFEEFDNRLSALPISVETIRRLKTVRHVENQIIELSKLLSWQVVENEVANYFLNEIRCRVVEKYKYKVLLEQYPQFALIPVNAAGAGNADKFTINLSDYLEELFEDNFTLDAKCYTSTSVDYKTMEKVLHHLSKNPLDSRRVIIIATTNNVTCWDDVWSFKNATGKYKLIIFTAKLIAEVSVHLGFHEELLEILIDYSKKS